MRKEVFINIRISPLNVCNHCIRRSLNSRNFLPHTFHSLIYSFRQKCLLSTYSVLSTVLDAGDTVVNKTDNFPFFL